VDLRSKLTLEITGIAMEAEGRLLLRLLGLKALGVEIAIDFGTDSLVHQHSRLRWTS